MKNATFRPHIPTHAPGFTLVEILVVVIVIGVLAAMIVPQFFGRVGQAKTSVARQKVATIESAIQIFQTDYGRLPRTLDELVNRPGDIPAEKWHAPTIKPKDLIDPWDRPFLYHAPGNHGVFDLYSLGADGQSGGDGENADITNW